VIKRIAPQPLRWYPLVSQTGTLSDWNRHFDEAIDVALLANRLKIGIVPTNVQQAIVRQRKGQARLRTLTILNYEASCAVCDITEQRLLIASHIVGWAEGPDHRGDLSNVICLCRIHDPLFEAGYWSLDDSLALLKKRAQSKTITLVLDAMTAFRPPLKHCPAQCFVKHHRGRSGL
jgi:HNH endonuclease